MCKNFFLTQNLIGAIAFTFLVLINHNVTSAARVVTLERKRIHSLVKYVGGPVLMLSTFYLVHRLLSPTGSPSGGCARNSSECLREKIPVTIDGVNGGIITQEYLRTTRICNILDNIANSNGGYCSSCKLVNKKTGQEHERWDLIGELDPTARYSIQPSIPQVISVTVDWGWANAIRITEQKYSKADSIGTILSDGPSDRDWGWSTLVNKKTGQKHERWELVGELDPSAEYAVEDSAYE